MARGARGPLSPQETGLLGYQVTLARHGRARMNEWRRRGGRPADPTLDEIRAAKAAIQSRHPRRMQPTGQEIRAEVIAMRKAANGLPGDPKRSRSSRHTEEPSITEPARGRADDSSPAAREVELGVRSIELPHGQSDASRATSRAGEALPPSSDWGAVSPATKSGPELVARDRQMDS